MPRFSVRQARGREPWIRTMIAEQITYLRDRGPVVDLWREYGMHISARKNCHVIGIPDRHRSEEHTSELQSLMCLSFAVFCLITIISNFTSLSYTTLIRTYLPF